MWPATPGHVRTFSDLLPAAVVVALAVITRCFVWLNTDVSWLLTLSEQALTDPHLYLHYNETNPPACFLIYMPAILIGRVIPITPESIVTILVFAATLLCLWMVRRILSGSGLIPPRQQPALLAVACAILLILPGDNFAEREHIALIALLPMLAVYAKRADGATVGIALAAIAGVGGALAVAIKLHFVLPIIFPLAYAAWSLRDQRTKLIGLLFSPEHLAIVLVLVAYVLLIVSRYPDYIHYTIPLALAIYVPMKTSPLLMMANMSVILTVASMLVSVALGMTDIQRRYIHVGNLAALGFAIALIVQGKGWAYQGYPAMALSMLMLAVLLIGRVFKTLNSHDASGPSMRIAALLSAVLCLCIYALASTWLLGEPDRSPLVREVSRLVPIPHPKVISITGGPGIAFPLTRKLSGASIGHEPWQTVSAYAETLLSSPDLDPSARRKIEEYARLDRIQLGDTIRTQRPDVVLFGGRALELWAFSHPEVAAALRPYREAALVDGIGIWLPRKCLPRTGPCGALR